MDPSLDATMNDAPFLIPPTRFLFQPAHRPKHDIGTLASPGRRGLFELVQHDLTCASDETTCSQGSWCCGSGSTCSLDDGAFFCCPPEAGQDGCARVCTTGDFQCGNVCCADGQTCMGADSGSPYCVNPGSNTLMSSSALPTTPTTTALISSTVAQTTPTMMTLSTTSTTLLTTPTTTSNTTKPTSSSMTSSSQPAAAPTVVFSSSSSSSREGGIPMAAQVSIGVIVPVVCIFLVFGLWMVLFRRSKSRRITMREAPGDFPPRFHVVGPPDFDRPSSYYPTTPPPAYTKSATTLDSTVPAASSAATSVYGNESLSPEQGMEMSTLSVPLSPSPVLPALDQRLSVMDVRLSVASTTVGTSEHDYQAGYGPEADDMHPRTPVNSSRTTMLIPRRPVGQMVDENGVRPGTAL